MRGEGRGAHDKYVMTWDENVVGFLSMVPVCLVFFNAMYVTEKGK